MNLNLNTDRFKFHRKIRIPELDVIHSLKPLYLLLIILVTFQ